MLCRSGGRGKDVGRVEEGTSMGNSFMHQNGKPTASRKKKCDATGFPCWTCTRLGLACEYKTVLVWEDDERRTGMKRRGPPPLKKMRICALENSAGSSSNERDAPHQNNESLSPHAELDCVTQLDGSEDECEDARSPEITGDQTSQVTRPLPFQAVRYQHLSLFPHNLNTAESLLLENYVQRFSRMYPTCSGPRNPFLTVLLPLAMRNEVVLNSLLALSGVQRWDHYDHNMERETLRLRQRALRGCRLLLEETGLVMPSGAVKDLKLGEVALVQGTSLGDLDLMDEERALILLTSSNLLLIYEKISGEPNWTPHLDFMNRLLSHLFKRFVNDFASDRVSNSATTETMEALRFLHSSFLYNDLIRSTSLRTATLSKFYLEAALPCLPSLAKDLQPTTTIEHGMAESSQSRYYFPNLIARISSGDQMVSDEEIVAWDGNLDWLPSFSLLDARSGSISTTHILECPPPKEPLSYDADGTCSDTSSWNEQQIITELYSTVARIYRREFVGHHHLDTTSTAGIHASEVESSETLASRAIQLVQLLPGGSIFENTLLWPIGIAAKVLTQKHAMLRSYIISRLRSLEQRFQMRHFKRVQDVLISHWKMLDSGTVTDSSQSELVSEILLLG